MVEKEELKKLNFNEQKILYNRMLIDIQFNAFDIHKDYNKEIKCCESE